MDFDSWLLAILKRGEPNFGLHPVTNKLRSPGFRELQRSQRPQRGCGIQSFFGGHRGWWAGIARVDGRSKKEKGDFAAYGRAGKFGFVRENRLAKRFPTSATIRERTQYKIVARFSPISRGVHQKLSPHPPSVTSVTSVR